jgi:hypothetical protein
LTGDNLKVRQERIVDARHLGLLAKTDTLGRQQTALRNRFLIRGSVLSIVLGNLQVVGTGFVVADFLNVVFDDTLEHSSCDHSVRKPSARKLLLLIE